MKESKSRSSNARRLLLKVFIGFLSLTAILAIISVLTGDFGELQAKVLATTLTISAVSVCSMAGAAFLEIRRRVAVAIAGIAFIVIAGMLVVGGIWGESNDEEYWRTTFTFVVVGLVFAYGFMTAVPQVARSYRWIYLACPLSAAIFGMEILAVIWEAVDSNEWFRFMAATSIVVVLLSVVEPILVRMSRVSAGQSDRLQLRQKYENVYQDAEGRLYHVTPLAANDGEGSEADVSKTT